MKIEVKNAYFSYDKNNPVLRNINFEIGESDIVTVLGPNGVGKTTLLKCMMGLRKWHKGATYIDGRKIKDIPHREMWQKIAYVPQAKSNVFAYTVLDMVMLGRSAHLSMFEQPHEEDRKIAEECLEDVGYLHLKDKLCNQISGGELQMVLIARALATQPKLLVLDEPESGLDFRNQIIVLDTIKKLCHEKQISSIVNTHYPKHALQISKKALMLNKNGKSIFGETKNIITDNNLRQSFGVNVSIKDVLVGEVMHKCVLPLSLAN